jgi:hypothetical protein
MDGWMEYIVSCGCGAGCCRVSVSGAANSRDTVRGAASATAGATIAGDVELDSTQLMLVQLS